MSRNKNRFFTVILVFVTVLFSCFYVQGSSETVKSPETVFDTEKNTVTVSGIHPIGEGARVSIEVRVDNSTFYKREISAEENGAFSIVYKMAAGTEESEGDKSGIYTVLIGGAGLTAVVKQYTFINIKDSEIIVAEANAAKTAAEMKKVLETHAGALNIDLGKGGSFGALSEDGQTAVYAALARETNFGTANNIISMFESAVAIQNLNEANTDEAEELVRRYKNILGFDMNADSAFAKIQRGDSKSKVYAAMTGGKLPLNDKAAAAAAFESAVYTQLFNEITTGTRDKFMEYVEKCNAFGYAAFSLNDYNSARISDTDRADIIADVISEAAETPFRNLSEVTAAFENAAKAKVKKADGESTSQKSSGGGGGRVAVQNINNAASGAAEAGTSEASAVFSDLSGSEWAVNAINYLAARGIVNGIGDGKFDPNGEVKREEFVKMLLLALKVPSEETEKRFIDVDESAWYYSYVKDAYALNIVTGIDFDIFGTGQSISREQMCTMLCRAMKFMDINIEDNENEMLFYDKNEISEYAFDSVDALYRAGIVNGISAERFNPNGTATRAMASQVLYKIMQRGNLQ